MKIHLVKNGSQENINSLINLLDEGYEVIRCDTAKKLTKKQTGGMGTVASPHTYTTYTIETLVYILDKPFN